MVETNKGLLFMYSAAPQSWANSQKPAKVKVENFVKLTDHTCVCNDLTSFEYEAQATGNRILQLFVLIFFNKSATNNLRQILD
jgi:hypothetical protein